MVHTQKKPGDIVLPYEFAKDSFLVRITDLTANAQQGDTIHFIYYSDESLKSGQLIEKRIALNNAGLLAKNYVFVGFAHFGQFRPKRRRDFIAPSVKTDSGFEGKSSNYGQADVFYDFLEQRIIPLAEKKFEGHPIERSFIGHSLGGLFATYLLVNEDSLFTNLYALSPALWIDDYHVLNYESMNQERLKTIRKNVWISCGSNETLNRIKNGVERIKDTLDKRKYPGLSYRVKIYPYKTHNSSVPPTLDELFAQWVKN